MTKYLDNEGLTHFTGKMKEYADGKAGEVDSKVTTHINDKKNNPHGVTKAQVGLGNVTNVAQIPLSQRGAINGVATLDAKGKVPTTQMPETKTINGKSIFGSGNLQLSASLYEIVDALPTTGIDTSKIYLVPAESFTTNNYKTEYIYLGDPNKAYDESKWEKIGDEKTNNMTPTPGGSITVDTAFNATSSNPIANKTVTDKFAIVDRALGTKVAQDTYDTKMTAIDSKLKTLENKTIDVDAELKVSTNPVQNTAVKKAVDDLNIAIGKKANSSDLTTANSKITTLETNAATILKVIGNEDDNGISSISKSGNTITATKAKFLTSAVGLATTAMLTEELKKKSDVGHTHSQYLTAHQSLADYATQAWVNSQGFAKGAIPTKVSDLQNDSGFLTATALTGYVNKVQPDTSTTGNGVVDITKNGNTITVKKGTFLTEHQSLADYATQAWVKQNAATQKWVQEQKYLTANDLQETIKITLVSTKSTSDAALRGAKITVKNGSSTIGTYTWQGSVISLKVASGLEVTVSVSDVTGYKTPAEQKFMTAMSNIREVKMEYKEQKLGIYILETDGTMTEPANWNKDNSSTVLGIYVGGENCVFVMATEGANKPWSTQLNTVVPGVKSEDGSESPTTDYDGIGNTKKFIDASPKDNTISSAAYYCNNYKFKNGKNGYLFALGEALVVRKNFIKITQAYNAIGCSDTAVSLQNDYWTSNQDTRYRAWCGKIGTIDASPGGRGEEKFVIPVCQF